MIIELKHPELAADKVNCATLRESGVLPVSKMTKAHVPGVATSFKGLLKEESDLPIVHTSDGFDLDAYTLMEEPEYNFSKLPSPRYDIDA